MSEHPSFSSPLMPPGEPIEGKTYRADGWAYFDAPKMKPEFWDELLELIGDGHYHVLTEASYGNGLKRGQILISPTGLDRISARAKGYKSGSAEPKV